MNNQFDDLIQQINNTAQTERDRGTYFEKLVVAYLKNEPTYKNLYTDVWMLNEVPEEYGIAAEDNGVDIVARDVNGSLTGVQAKFYKNKVGKDEINSFIAELGKKQYAKGLIVSTVDEWNSKAQATIDGQSKDVQRIGLTDLRNSQVDWSSFSFEHAETVQVKAKKGVRNYQQEAIDRAVDYFRDHDRGQLIMAPGTGKTFTSLKFMERMARDAAQEQYRVLYLVPSIQLLTQTLRGWNNDLSDDFTITNMAVTSDRNASRASKEDNEDIKPDDIGFPATTSTEQIMKNWTDIQKEELKDVLVVFSTYQSIDVIGQAQRDGFPEFDLIIADEAHKTTGDKALGAEYSSFTKVHNNENVAGKIRLYQTATPKIYGAEAKATAIEQSIELISMDKPEQYGEVIYRLGFGDAVSRDILTDYKLMVLAVDESAIQRDMQNVISDPENGLNIDDVGRIIGVWNAMMKRHGYPSVNKYDGAPMRRAIAFTSVIDANKTRREGVVGSKQFANDFEYVINEYLGNDSDEHMQVNVRHADGTMNALQKNDVLSWLADDSLPEDEARIVSNVKFLTEGIDVPTLDSVIFLAPKRSQVDIVQAIGRIMRKAPGKDYGYIILPVVVPAGVNPESILDNNKKFDVIWQVMNALRSVDERFEATVNKLQLNKKKPGNIGIEVVGKHPKKTNHIGGAKAIDGDDGSGDVDVEPISPQQMELNLQWDEMKEAIYGKIVQKVGDRKYLEDWSDDVAKIAERYINWIKTKLEDDKDPVTIEFNKFVDSLKHNINESIDKNQAIEMLAQHMITKPVFQALFDEYSFVNNNPVSSAMENIIVELEKAGFTKEQKDLEPFYESVRLRAEGIDNAEAKQKIIVTLYDKFFSKAFKSTTEKLGIVFTPIEVVDFIVKSVDDVLQKHFGKSLASKGVHVLDPFTGTGTFIVRTLTYLKQKMDAGELTLAEITRKYTQELHANEIVLLSYYIAAINIEATFDDVNGDDEGYVPFEGIVLTDTFESTENEDTLDDVYFGTNDERLKRQQAVPITAVIGNPPYSKGQSSENDNNKNEEYPRLFESIQNTYVANSSTSSVLSMYDSYILAFRWASNRILDRGVVAFVSNGSFIDSQSADGFRKSVGDEFNHLYIFNLRGDARTSGEQRRKEKDNIFGQGSRTTIAISVLVKDGSNDHEIHYADVGDYLTRAEKLSVVLEAGSVLNVDWETVSPDKNNDWVNQRDENYESYRATADEENSWFGLKDLGIVTNRDAWVSNYSQNNLIQNVRRMIDNYNLEVDGLSDVNEKLNDKTVTPYITDDETKVSWSRSLKQRAARREKADFDDESVMLAMYRPFVKKFVYRNRFLNENVRKTYTTFPDKNSKNIFINVAGAGAKSGFSLLASEEIPFMDMISKSRNFPRYTYDKGSLMGDRVDNIKSDDDFYYVYAVMHSNTYRTRYANDLLKDLPRIPNLKEKSEYIRIGKELLDLHLNYESVPAPAQVKVVGVTDNYRVKKMKHPKKDALDTIIYNSDITISGIPERAYDYVINGRPAIEWILDQYQVKEDKKSGIMDDPNEFSDDPKYILNLLLSVIAVSMKTLDLIEQLPEFEIVE